MKTVNKHEINQIGTYGLQKTHPKSFIITVHTDSDKGKLIYNAPHFYRFKNETSDVEVVVLQCLYLSPDSPKFYMVEIVKKSEYES